MIVCAFLSHHIRDASRRGFWIYPFGHTHPIPYYLYILLTFIVPSFLSILLKINYVEKEMYDMNPINFV